MSKDIQEAQLFLQEDIPMNTSPTKKRKHDKVTFKPYIQDKYLIPPVVDDYVGEHNIAKLISAIIDKMDLSKIYTKYKGGGASAYDSRMLLKVWLLGFVYKFYSCRRLAMALGENAAFIWLSGNYLPGTL